MSSLPIPSSDRDPVVVQIQNNGKQLSRSHAALRARAKEISLRRQTERIRSLLRRRISPAAVKTRQLLRLGKALSAEHLGAYAAFLLQFFCGLRRLECEEALWSDIQPRSRSGGYCITVSSRKGAFVRQVPISARVIRQLALTNGGRRTGHIIAGETAGLQRVAFYMLSRKLREHLGPDVEANVLRRAYIRRRIRAVGVIDAASSSGASLQMLVRHHLQS